MECEAKPFLSFDDVEQRLVEAVRCAWRMPDREGGWLSVRAYWPDIQRIDPGDQVAGIGGEMVQVKLRPVPNTRRDIAEMEEAFGWMKHVADKDRRVVALAVAALAAGSSQVPWSRLLRPMGLRRGAGGLRMRYGRAITAICKAIN